MRRKYTKPRARPRQHMPRRYLMSDEDCQAASEARHIALPTLAPGGEREVTDAEKLDFINRGYRELSKGPAAMWIGALGGGAENFLIKSWEQYKARLGGANFEARGDGQQLRGEKGTLSPEERNFWDSFPDLLCDDPEDPLNELYGRMRDVAQEWWREHGQA